MVEVHIAQEAERAMAYALRYEVFIEEQGVDPALERDEHDDTALHAVAVEDGCVVGCGRLLIEGAQAHVGRLAVKRTSRGRGIGAALCRFFVEESRRGGCTYIWLNSQLHAASFYEKCGFHREGEIFSEAGIDHVRMVRSV